MWLKKVGQVVEESHVGAQQIPRAYYDAADGLLSISALLQGRAWVLGLRGCKVLGLQSRGEWSSVTQGGEYTLGLQAGGTPRGKPSCFCCERISKEPQAEAKSAQRKIFYKSGQFRPRLIMLYKFWGGLGNFLQTSRGLDMLYIKIKIFDFSKKKKN